MHTFTDQNTSPSPQHSNTNMHLTITPPAPAAHKKTHAPLLSHTETHWSLVCNQIHLPLQSDTLIYSILFCGGLNLDLSWEGGKNKGISQLSPFMALFYFNNGAVMPEWHPYSVGTGLGVFLCWWQKHQDGFAWLQRNMFSIWSDLFVARHKLHIQTLGYTCWLVNTEMVARG